MIGIYFSGTGNSKYCIEKFLREYDAEVQAFSIEDSEAVLQIQNHEDIVFGYPVQFSNLPKIVVDFVASHSEIWKDKKVFVIATMGMFSGDGAGILGRLLGENGARVTGGLHVRMPDSISDEKALKRTWEKNKELITGADAKIEQAVSKMKSGKWPQEGISFLYHMAGLFGQRLYFYNKTKNYTDKLKIDKQKCTGCGTCQELCPMGNIIMTGDTAVSGNRCTMCYRCINNCPKQAITLLGKQVVEQYTIDKYL